MGLILLLPRAKLPFREATGTVPAQRDQTWIAEGLVAWTAKGNGLTSRAFIFVQAAVLRKARLILSELVTTTSSSFLLPCLRPEFPELSELQLKAPVVLGWIKCCITLGSLTVRSQASQTACWQLQGDFWFLQSLWVSILILREKLSSCVFGFLLCGFFCFVLLVGLVFFEFMWVFVELAGWDFLF